MEIEGDDGTKLLLKAGVKVVLGRGTGFNTEDLTVSRRHLLLEFRPDAGTESSDRVFIEVLGRNPVWVRDGKASQKIRTFRKSETGEILAGDRFCLSGHRPLWFNLKRCDEVMEESVSEGESGLDNVNISDIDPVKEFGFLVAGKEFDQYPKNQIRDIKQWEWFLEDSAKGNSDDDDDDDEDEDEDKKGLSRKRRRKNGNKDDNWSGESEEDKEMMVKTKRVTGPSSSTRSKKTKTDTNASSNSSSSSAQTKQHGRVDVEEEEEDDEKLGGFIVSDEETKLEEDEEESNVDDEEEEEEEEDFDEDEDEE